MVKPKITSFKRVKSKSVVFRFGITFHSYYKLYKLRKMTRTVSTKPKDKTSLLRVSSSQKTGVLVGNKISPHVVVRGPM